MARITVFNTNDIEYDRLQTFANIVNNEMERAHNNTRVYVKETYFDFGQDWKYSALITYKSENDHWQSLCPRDWEMVADADSMAHLKAMAEYYAKGLLEGKICINLYEVF